MISMPCNSKDKNRRKQMKAFKTVLSLVVAASIFLIVGCLYAEESDKSDEFVPVRDCNVEYSKKNIEENQDYLNRIKEKAGIQGFFEADKIAGFIIDTNPSIEQAKYFVLLPIMGIPSLYENDICIHLGLKPGEKVSRQLLYSSVLSVLIDWRADKLKDVYFFLPEDASIPKDKKKNPAVIDIRKVDKKYGEICQQYNKVCFQLKGGGLLEKAADPRYDADWLKTFNDLRGIPMTMDEYKSWAYVIFITQTHNPYSKEFSMEKMFPLPNRPKEQVNLKNTIKLAEEAFQWMDTQALNLQKMATQGGNQ